MADWNSPLPGPAKPGSATHVEDHDALVAAITELRAVADAADAAATALAARVEALEAVLTD